MNLLEYQLSRAFLRFFGLIFRLFPLDRRKIVIASARENELTGNLRAVADGYAAAYPDAHIVLLLRTYSYGFRAKVAYLFSLVRTTYHLQTARLFYIDNALFPVHVVAHRRGTTVIQVWHATGVLKQFGLDTRVDERKVENRFIHRNYDYAIADSEPTRAAYAQAFGLPLDRVLGLGSPRTDLFFDPDACAAQRTRLIAEHPALAGDRHVILYAPTFRGFSRGKSAPETLNAVELKRALGDDYLLVYKPHAVTAPGRTAGFDLVLDPDTEINPYLTVADALITDYSSALFEYALLRRPLFKLCGDYAEYVGRVGFYLDYLTDIPGTNCSNTAALARAILARGEDLTLDEEERARFAAFTAKYCTYSDGSSTHRLIERFPLD